uniref:Uncharacterized protein n=1 Tax=Amphiprion percula TaxID=161767 RepID=A0A3P8T0P2_AMPPE
LMHTTFLIGRRSEQKDGPQPAEAEYLSSRYEHFSRALSQSSTFSSESKPIRVTQPSASAAKMINNTVCQSFIHLSPVPASPLYLSQSTQNFSTSPVPFNHPDGTLWAGHMLSRARAATPNVHDVYHPHPHPHIHTRHHHPVLHTYPTHSPALDPRFSPLLLPGVRSQNQSATKMDPSSNSPVTAPSITWTPSALHGSFGGVRHR